MLIYDKTYEELVQEISQVSGMTASMVQNSNGKYQMVLSVSQGNSSVSQNNSTLAYTQDSATSYASDATTISYGNITKIY